MRGYVGVPCPVCKKKFVNGDDIVVCPICGAPHHRDCYAIENHCAFEEEHIGGKAWKPAADAAGDFCINPQDGERWPGNGIEAKTCAFCGVKNPKDNIFCCSCGNRLVDANSDSSPNGDFKRMVTYGGIVGADPRIAVYGGLSPTDSIGDESASEMASFVGPSSAYYIPKFKDLADGKRIISFSISAFFFGYLYFFYRKMYKIGALILALTLILSIPSFLYTRIMFPVSIKESFSSEQLDTLGINVDDLRITPEQMKQAKTYSSLSYYANIVNVTLKLAMGLFSVQLYYRHTTKAMKKVKDSQGTERVTPGETENALRERGGVNNKAVIILVFATIALSTAFMFTLVNRFI